MGKISAAKTEQDNDAQPETSALIDLTNFKDDQFQSPQKERPKNIDMERLIMNEELCDEEINLVHKNC